MEVEAVYYAGTRARESQSSSERPVSRSPIMIACQAVHRKYGIRIGNNEWGLEQSLWLSLRKDDTGKAERESYVPNYDLPTGRVK
jgi:hypothetical protein